MPLADVVTFPVSAINRCHCHITFSLKQPFQVYGKTQNRKMILNCYVLVCQCSFCKTAVILLHRDINQAMENKENSKTSRQKLNLASINNGSSLLFYFLLRRKIFGPSPCHVPVTNNQKGKSHSDFTHHQFRKS